MINALCDDHVGENFPPRCGVCESLSIEYSLLKIDLPQTAKTPGVVENDSHHASSSRVVWQGMECAWAECVRCNFDGPRRFGLLCHGQALIDLEDHTSRHRNISTPRLLPRGATDD